MPKASLAVRWHVASPTSELLTIHPQLSNSLDALDTVRRVTRLEVVNPDQVSLCRPADTWRITVTDGAVSVGDSSVPHMIGPSSRRSSTIPRTPGIDLALYSTKYQLEKFNGCGIMLSTSISTSADSLSIARTRASWPSGLPHLQDASMS